MVSIKTPTQNHINVVHSQTPPNPNKNDVSISHPQTGRTTFHYVRPR
jgi:hypothetical protein